MKQYVTTITKIIFCTLLISGCLLLCSCHKKPSVQSKSGFYFDTIIQITIYDNTDSDILERCFELAAYYDTLLDATNPDSDIWKINHSNERPVLVSDATIDLLKQALYYAKISDGVVDPTVYTVSSLWDFHDNEDAAIPSDSVIKEALSHVDYTKLLIDTANNTVTLTDPDSSINLGFIAKGYIADKIKELLITNHVTSANINLGGNVLVVGSKPDGTAFRIGVQAPFEKEGTTIAVVPLSDKSLVSSGLYERYFVKDDILYHHILDTSTGYPIENDLNSVTILSDSSLEGDAVSTLVFCLGLQKGMEFINAHPKLEALFITKDNELLYSSGFPH